MNTALHVAQPDWLAGWLGARALPVDDRGRLAEVIALAGEQVSRGGGGPFAAVVYDERSGERLAAAVNVVQPGACALAHAELLALGMAQQGIGHFTLAARPGVLVSSAEPCAMCLGAICWSGIARVLFSATRADVEAIGFDEGPRPPRWRRALAARGIAVGGPRQRRDGQAVLQRYRAQGGAVYNGRE